MGLSCDVPCSCSPEIRDNLIGVQGNVSSTEDCQRICSENADCNFYTYYNLNTSK